MFMQLLLKEEGFEDAKEYIICFCRTEKVITRNGKTHTEFVSASWIARVLVVLTVEIKAILNITIWDWKVRLKTGSKLNQ